MYLFGPLARAAVGHMELMMSVIVVQCQCTEMFGVTHTSQHCCWTPCADMRDGSWRWLGGSGCAHLGSVRHEALH